MAKKKNILVEPVESLIREIRSERVMLDSDLARVYGVPTFRFNEAVKRNLERFPEDFRFQLTRNEAESLTSQIAILKTSRGKHRKYLPYAFTEHGAIMAANVLSSRRAVVALPRIGGQVVNGWGMGIFSLIDFQSPQVI
ncbi:MAG: ORF6N domain-containing protein [Limisphaerales bacterium]